MSVTIYQRDTCRLCNSRLLNSILTLKPTPLEDDFLPPTMANASLQRYPLEVVMCVYCGNAQLSHVIAAESIYDHYIYQTQSSPGLIEYFRSACQSIQAKNHLKKGDCVVDIGCNDGAVLEIFRELGMRVVGVEPSPVAKVVKEKKINTYQSYLNPDTAIQITHEHGYPKLILANNVLANVDDLNAFVESVKIMMQSDTTFVVETGYWLSLVQNRVFDFIYHEHLNYFSIKPLKAFFNKHDMHLYDAETIETKGGSVRLYVQLKSNINKESQRLTQLMATEELFGLFNEAIYDDFYQLLMQTKKWCHQLLDSLNTSKEKMVGYGASASVTTLLHLFELGDQISFLVDDNAIKHNTLSPGYHLPVQPSSAIYDNDIRYALILPWRFEKAILSKNKTFGQKGGHFVAVYPTPRLLEVVE